jgi:hypothetical protein
MMWGARGVEGRRDEWGEAGESGRLGRGAFARSVLASL